MFSALFHATLWWIGQKLDEVFENSILGSITQKNLSRSCSRSAVVMFRIQEVNVLRTVLHFGVASLGVLFITSFLFCEMHMISMVRTLFVRLSIQTTTRNIGFVDAGEVLGDVIGTDADQTAHLSGSHVRVCLCTCVLPYASQHCWLRLLAG